MAKSEIIVLVLACFNIGMGISNLVFGDLVIGIIGLVAAAVILFIFTKIRKNNAKNRINNHKDGANASN
jgi:predicted membrane protein